MNSEFSSMICLKTSYFMALSEQSVNALQVDKLFPDAEMAFAYDIIAPSPFLNYTSSESMSFVLPK